MRDLHTRQTRSKRSRRIALALLLLAASPAAAEQPQGPLIRMMPPLPLQSISSGMVQRNPFCDPENLTGSDAVLLASGNGAIRLKPVQGDVGLHAIQEGQDLSSAPAVAVSAIPDTKVQQNPLVRSLHRDNADDLVETEVVEQLQPAAPLFGPPSASIQHTESKPTKSSIVLIPPVMADVQIAPAPRPDQDVKIVVPASKLHKASSLPEPVRTSATDAFEATDAREQESDATEQVQTSVAAEPILFSLSDRLDSEQPEVNAENNALTPADEQLDVELAEVDELDYQAFLELPQPTDEDALEVVESQPLVLEKDQLILAEPVEFAEPNELAEPNDVELAELDFSAELSQPLPHPQESPVASQPAADETIGIALVEPIVLDQLEPELRPLDVSTNQDPRPVAIQRRKASVIVAEAPAEPSLHAQRYRPPVAVTPVPNAYDREAESVLAEPDTGATVRPVDEVNLAGPQAKPIVPNNVKLTPLYMKSAQVRSLTVAGELRDVQVADKNVCQAVLSGPNQVKLIGTGDGVTQLVVWAQTDDPNRPMRMRAFEVHVDRMDPSVEAGGSTALLLKQSIRNAFPQCNVTLSQEGGELIVSGRCDNSESAEKIIRMIRKTCLVPVQDRLIVR